jgi:hypothetical protein
MKTKITSESPLEFQGALRRLNLILVRAVPLKGGDWLLMYVGKETL